MRPAYVALLALASGAVGGVVSTRLVSEAHADSAAIVVPVPVQGVVFRGPTGAAIARVRAEPSGGVVEVLDAREQIAVRLRATPNGGAIEMGPAHPALRPAFEVTRAVDDPGY
jgi:hypothetical protein